MKRDNYYYPSIIFEGEALPEAYLHDPSVLPPQVPGGFERLFPRVVTYDELEEESEEEDWLEQKGLEETGVAA